MFELAEILEIKLNKLLGLLVELPRTRIKQLFNVEPHAVAGISRDIMALRIHADRIFRARFHAIAAVDAQAQVDIETFRVFLNVGVGMLSRNNINTARRTDRLAHHAAYAARRAVLPLGQPVARA